MFVHEIGLFNWGCRLSSTFPIRSQIWFHNVLVVCFQQDQILLINLRRHRHGICPTGETFLFDILLGCLPGLNSVLFSHFHLSARWWADYGGLCLIPRVQILRRWLCRQKRHDTSSFKPILKLLGRGSTFDRVRFGWFALALFPLYFLSGRVNYLLVWHVLILIRLLHSSLGAYIDVAT